MQSFSAKDIYLHRTLQNLSATTRHSRAVFVRARANEKQDKYCSTVWLLDTAATAGQRARQLTAPQFSASSLCIDHAGERVAFVSTRDQDKGQQIHVLRLDGGEARAVTDTSDKISSVLAWSHDGRRLLAIQSVQWAEDEHDEFDADSRPIVVRYLPYKLDGSGPKVGKRKRLIEVDVESGDVRPLVEGDFDVSDACWSPDGRVLAFSRKRSGLQRHQADLWLADADGAHARQVTDDLHSVSGLAFSPDGRRLAFTGSRIEGDSLVNLYFHDIESGKRRCIDEDALQIEGSTVVWHPDGTRVATVGARDGLFVPTVVDVARGAVTPLDIGPCQVTAFAASGDNLVYVAASLREADELFRIDWDGGNRRRLTAFNRKWFHQRARPIVENRTFDVPDGKGGTESIQAWLMRPKGDGPFPLLVDFHGGPQSVALLDYASHAYWWELVSKGWAVLAPNPVGSAGRTGEFARRLRGHWGEYDLPQVEAVIRRLRDENIAGPRLACYGKSYGGYLSAWAAANSDLFKAAVVSAPVIDLRSHGGTSDTGYYVTPYAMDAPLYDPSDAYTRLSPVMHAPKVEAAVLFLQGQEDHRCPVGQCEQMLASLIRAGHERTMMVVYPGGSHQLAGTGRPSHRVDYHRRIVEWVERHT